MDPMELILEQVRLVNAGIMKMEEKLGSIEHNFHTSLAQCRARSDSNFSKADNRLREIENKQSHLNGCNEGKHQYSTATLIVGQSILLAAAAIAGGLISRL